MSTVDRLVERYSDLVARPWDSSLAGDQKVWFVVYDPAQERRLRLHLTKFEIATRDAKRGWRHLDLTEVFAQWMAAHRYRDRYFANPAFAVYALTDFKAHLAQMVREELHADGVDNATVLALSGVASLFGLVRVSELIDDVAGEIKGRLVVFFPGSYDEKSYFRLLDARDGWDYLAVPITAT
jgi:hypothetical protein